MGGERAPLPRLSGRTVREVSAKLSFIMPSSEMVVVAQNDMLNSSCFSTADSTRGEEKREERREKREERREKS